MKQKLKLLLAYFRAFKTDVLDTYINFDYNHMESWDLKFTTKEGKEIKLPTKLQETFEDILKSYMQKFHRENDYDESEWWTLLVYVYPKQNRINFQSECEIVTESDGQQTFSLNRKNTQLSPTTLDLVDTIFKEDLKDKDKFNFEFNGNYDQIDVNLDFYIFINDDINYIELTDQLMTNILDRWWTDGPGSYGTIYVEKDKSIRMEFFTKSKDHEMTEMNINVTPDNIKE
jgi:hypothetical protein